MILATLNISSGEWAVIEDGDLASVAIGFTSETTPTTFDNLSFGWTVTSSNLPPVSFSYPEKDEIYVSTDQQYVVSESIAFDPDDECLISIWAKNSGEEYKTEHTFVVPKPDSPYDSWLWDSDKQAWVPPTAYPEDGQTYVWDESSTSWILYGLEEN